MKSVGLKLSSFALWKGNKHAASYITCLSQNWNKGFQFCHIVLRLEIALLPHSKYFLLLDSSKVLFYQNTCGCKQVRYRKSVIEWLLATHYQQIGHIKCLWDTGLRLHLMKLRIWILSCGTRVTIFIYSGPPFLLLSFKEQISSHSSSP